MLETCSLSEELATTGSANPLSRKAHVPQDFSSWSSFDPFENSLFLQIAKLDGSRLTMVQTNTAHHFL
jgi:hypothetical protein